MTALALKSGRSLLMALVVILITSGSSFHDQGGGDWAQERTRESTGSSYERSRGGKARGGGEHVTTSADREGRSRSRHNRAVATSRADPEVEAEGSQRASSRGGGDAGSFSKGILTPCVPPRLSRAESEIVYGPSSRRKAAGRHSHGSSSSRRRSTPSYPDEALPPGDRLTGFAALLASSHRRGHLSPERGNDRARSLSPTWHQTNRQPQATAVDHHPLPNKAPGVSFAAGPPRVITDAEPDLVREEDDQGIALSDETRIEWKKGELIGKGTFGRVFMGLNERTGELFAVKEIDLNDGTEEEVARLEREITLMKRLDYKHIVRYYGTAHDRHSLFIFMEYVPGGSISSMLSQFGPFKEDLIRKFIRQILLGTSYLHSKGIVHRDIKGANVLVTDQGVAKLTDFGCSKQLHGIQSASLEDSLRAITGSVPWMAPEVIKQTGKNPYAADIWSMGATVIEMATGTHPWPEFNNQLAAIFHVATSTEPPRIPENLSRCAQDFLSRCLVIDEEKRASASDLLHHSFVAEGE